MTVKAYEIEKGQMLKPTRTRFPETYYTLNPKPVAALVEALEFRAKAQRLDSHDCWLLNRLKAGWIPLIRVVRRPGGAEAKSLTAAPPDYTFRVINHKPRRTTRRPEPTGQGSLF